MVISNNYIGTDRKFFRPSLIKWILSTKMQRLYEGQCFPVLQETNSGWDLYFTERYLINLNVLIFFHGAAAPSTLSLKSYVAR